MPTFFRCVLSLILTLTVSLPALAQLQKFEYNKTRAQLEELRDHPHPLQIESVGKFSDSKAEAFFNYYKSEILPIYQNFIPQYYKSYALMLLTDTGLYKDEDERDKWLADREEADAKLHAHSTDPSVTEKLRIWSELSEGLSGEFPDEARKTYIDRVRWSFPEDQQDRLNELSRLENEYDVAINSVPATDDLADIEKEKNDAIIKLKPEIRAGKTSFEKAAEIIAEIESRGGRRMIAAQALEQHPDYLNRMAVLRSELAHSKGFNTWAEYALSNDDGYDESFRGVDTQRQFLLRYINSMAPRVRGMLDERAKALGIAPELVTNRYSPLIYPEAIEDLNPYFPANRITGIWEETMKESGFKDHTLSQILIDDEVRKNKNVTGAYNATIQEPYLDVARVDAQSLNYIVPAREDALWKPGYSYIMQSYKDVGFDDIETMFHEGGHALEAILKQKYLYRNEGNAYVETPSTSMEYFLKDAEFMHSKLVSIDGKKPSIQRVQSLIDNKKLGDAEMRLITAGRSLIEINLWDYDYSQAGAQTFVERLKQLVDEIDVLTLNRPTKDEKYPNYLERIATSHYYNGTVRYIGYTLADLSSQQMVSFIKDELEQRTGRRSLLKQKDLAELFGDKFFAEGWKTSFPSNIEEITGRNFDPTSLAEEFLADFKQDCEVVLKN